ncbi:MAG: TatD family hydrolase [Lachnospiraceae bacterium]|nr:TatD family hydrolase [Lachnospiraceae bacterium]
MIFETHAHYDDRQFDEDRDDLLRSLPGAGIDKVVNIGASMGSNQQTLELIKQYDFVYGVLGIHPNDTDQLEEAGLEWLEEACKHPKCLAIGEIGLDYYWDEPDREIQKKWFRRQLNLARKMHLPVVIHSRDAAQDTIDIMKEEKAQEIGGVIHCFSYTKETAKIFLDMGFYIGVGGVITFSNGKKLKEAVEEIPMDRIVLETDCPYLAPVPFRGKRNSSLNLTYVVEAIAEIKGISKEEVERITYDNAKRLYRMA